MTNPDLVEEVAMVISINTGFERDERLYGPDWRHYTIAARAAIETVLVALDDMAIGPEKTFLTVFAQAHNIFGRKAE